MAGDLVITQVPVQGTWVLEGPRKALVIPEGKVYGQKPNEYPSIYWASPRSNISKVTGAGVSQKEQREGHLGV